MLTYPQIMKNPIDKIILTSVDINNNVHTYNLVGHNEPVCVSGMREITLRGLINPDYKDEILEAPKLAVVSGIFQDSIYIFKDCYLTEFSMSAGPTTNWDIQFEMNARDVEVYNDLEIQFKDKKKVVSAVNFATVYEEYGDPKLMSYNEFCKKCLSAKI